MASMNSIEVSNYTQIHTKNCKKNKGFLTLFQLNFQFMIAIAPQVTIYPLHVNQC